jgi:hypothetical protein
MKGKGGGASSYMDHKVIMWEKFKKYIESLCNKVKDPLLDQEYRNNIMEDIECLKK